MPSPVFALKGRNSDPGVTNVRNVSSPHWRRWLGIESRCVVPFTSFAEHEKLPDGTLLAAVRFDTFFGDGWAKGGLAICH